MYDQMKELQDIFTKWCPKNFEDEPVQTRLFRALLNANACVLDLERVVLGQEPIRPLSSYPLNIQVVGNRFVDSNDTESANNV